MTLVVEWLGPVLGVVFTVVLVGVHGVVCEAMVARVRKQPAGVHWSERNRTITEAKSAMLMSAIAVMVAGQVTRLVLLGPFSAPDPWLVGLPVAVVQLAALWSLSARATRAIDPPEMPTVVATQTRLVFAMVVLTTLIGLALIWYLGAGDHPAALAGWFVGSTGLVLAYWNLDRVLAALGLLSAAPPSVRQAAAGADLDPDAVHELHFDRPNALAFPSGAVGVTSGMIAALDADEVASILRHERVHTIESRTTKLSRVLPLVLVCLVGPLVVGSFDRNLSTNLPVGLVVLLATLVVLAQPSGGGAAISNTTPTTKPSSTIRRCSPRRWRRSTGAAGSP